jgi:hypothetical protein
VKIAIFLEMTGEITVSVFKNAPTIPKKHTPHCYSKGYYRECRLRTPPLGKVPLLRDQALIVNDFIFTNSLTYKLSFVAERGRTREGSTIVNFKSRSGQK